MPMIEVASDGAVAAVFLNRPDVRNAFNAATIRELTEAFRDLGRRTDLRAIVLGAQGKAFCAGADLAWMRDMAANTWEQNRADAQALADMLWTLYTCPLPVIARVQGDCYAGGVGLAAVCDVVVAAREVQFSLSEARLGLLPATIAPYVVRALGVQAARRYFISAERFSAAEAHRLGLVHELADADTLDEKVGLLVSTIAANGPHAVKACKALVRDVAGAAITAELRAETARRIADIRASDEGREGMVAFLARRAPAWSLPAHAAVVPPATENAPLDDPA